MADAKKISFCSEGSVMNHKFLTAYGAYDSHKADGPDRSKAGTLYSGITWHEIEELAQSPSASKKTNAQFFIPSSYREHDGRSHAVQRAQGVFHCLTIDIDDGSPALGQIQTALRAVVGDVTWIIYSTASARPGVFKWRVLLLLSTPIIGVDFADTLNAFYDLMARQGILCDRALARPGQPVYLPNIPLGNRDESGRPNYYKFDFNRKTVLELTKPNKILQHRELMRKEHAQRKFEKAEEYARRMEKMEASVQQGVHFGNISEAFNALKPIAQLLGKYGYEQHESSNHWRSPYQGSSSYATLDFDDHWVSLSGSDLDAGLGHRSESFCSGTAFDLYAHFEHAGNYTIAARTCYQAGLASEIILDIPNLMKKWEEK